MGELVVLFGVVGMGVEMVDMLVILLFCVKEFWKKCLYLLCVLIDVDFLNYYFIVCVNGFFYLQDLFSYVGGGVWEMDVILEIVDFVVELKKISIV